MRLPAEFGRGAAAGVFLTTVGICALAGLFFGAGLSPLLETAVFIVGGVLCFFLARAVTQALLALGRLLPPRAIVLIVAAFVTLVVLRQVGFRWPESLFYPAASIFVLTQASLSGVVWSWFRKDGSSRRLLTAIAIGAVSLDVVALVFLASEGRDPFPIEAAVEGPAPLSLDLPNPGARGQHDVKTFTYGSGHDARRPEFGPDADWVSESVDASKLLPEWKGFRRRMREWYWGFPLTEAPLNGRVWMPDGDGPFPLVLIVHGNHQMEEYSDPGYAYLGELLASRGFLTVSVDENYVNATWSGDFRGKEMPLRAWLLLQHLSQWRQWSTTTGHPMEGKADLERVALIGHSRGGEAVGIAAAFNRHSYFPDDATVAFDFGFGIRGIVAIAQTDVRYSRRIELTDVSFLALQGSYDSDEASFFGLRQFRRIDFESEGYFLKAGVYVHGANHGQFNTVWGRTDAGPPYSWLLNLRPIISGADQRRIAEVYISAFLESTLGEEHDYIPLFRDPRVGREWLPDALIVPQFADSNVVSIADFEEDIDVTTATRAGGRIEASEVALWREEELLFRDDQKQGTSAVVLGWKPSSEALYRIRFTPLESAGSHLTFSLSLSDEKLAKDQNEGRDEPKSTILPRVIVEVEDESGESAEVPLEAVAPLAVPLKVQFLKLERWNREAHGRTWEPTLRSYEIPLNAFFERNTELDLSRLAAVRFRFRGDGEGVVILDDVGIRRDER